MDVVQDDEIKTILQSNHGFSDPAIWIPYARKHGFRRVAFEAVDFCPDCSSPTRRTLGQFVYYSTLISLVECDQCCLGYVDCRIDAGVIRQHFEKSYKDRQYFARERRAIFGQIAAIVAEHLPFNGSYLDIGGGMGHLAARVSKLRPDATVTLNDLSERSCESVREELDIETISGPFTQLFDVGLRFDLITMIDVAYYEPEVSRMWEGVRRMLKPGGILLMRLPNKFGLIKCCELAKRLLAPFSSQKLCSRLQFFNPEHVSLFSKYYLLNRLPTAGFESVRFFPQLRF